MTIDYERLEADARAALEQPLQDLRGSVHVWTMFTKAHEVGKELHRGVEDGVSAWSRHALTGMMVVDYAKPWTKNLEAAVRNLDLAFLAPIESRPLHEQLVEYRHQAVAHLDAGVQPDGVGLIGAEAANLRHATDEFDKVFIPGRVRIDVAMTLGLINVDEIAAIVDHIGDAVNLTEQQVSRAAAAVRDAALQHAPVLDRLSDRLTFTVVPPDEMGNRQMPGHAMSPSPAKKNRSVTIGGREFREVITVWESAPSNMSFDQVGNGFRIRCVLAPPDDRVEFQAFFLKYEPGRG